MNSQLLLKESRQAIVLNAIAQMARTFWGPDPESCRQMLAGSFLEPFEILGRLVDYQPPGILEELKAGLLPFADGEALFEYLEANYVRLFINNRHRPIIPLYASCHLKGGRPAGQGRALMGPPAMEMKKRLDACSLSLGGDIHHPPDHLSIELEFLYFLLEKGWSRKDRKLLAEAAVFAGEEMLPWISVFHNQLTRETTCWFYPPMTSILQSALAHIGGLKSRT